MIFTFRARDRRGMWRVGRWTGDPARFAEQAFATGWRELELTDEHGDQVGGIGPHPETGRRTWWGERERGDAA